MRHSVYQRKRRLSRAILDSGGVIRSLDGWHGVGWADSDSRRDVLGRESGYRQRIDVHRRLLSRHAKIVLADDVIAVEHAARYVARHRHRDSFGDARAHHVPGRGAAQVVEQLTGYPGSLTGGGPGLREIADRLTVPVEHQRSNVDVAVLLEQPRLPAAVYELGEITLQHREVPQIIGKGSDDGFQVGSLKEALPCVVFGQHPDLRGQLGCPSKQERSILSRYFSHVSAS